MSAWGRMNVTPLLIAPTLTVLTRVHVKMVTRETEGSVLRVRYKLTNSSNDISFELNVIQALTLEAPIVITIKFLLIILVHYNTYKS